MYLKRNIVFLLILATFLSGCMGHRQEPVSDIDISNFSDGIHHWFLFAKATNYKRFAANDYSAIAKNIVHYQNQDGGWPKNIDWLADINADSLLESMSTFQRQSTFDNDNTYPQIDFLARMYRKTANEIFRQSAEKGLYYILNAQNASGGWRGWDVDAITFNDNVTSGIMNLLLDIKEDQPHFAWIDNVLRNSLDSALQAAIRVTLLCQIEVNGIKKGWCQQHDHTNLKPVKGRSYELSSIASRETVTILECLIRISDPELAIVEAIEAGVRWLEESKIENLRIEKQQIDKATYPGQNLDIDRIAITDSLAPCIWARFYEIEDNTPFMCTRDGEKVYTLDEVNPERRGGYAWYGYWPEKLLTEGYPSWRQKIFRNKK